MAISSVLRRVARGLLVLAGVALVLFAVLSPLFELGDVLAFLTDRRTLLVRLAALLCGFVLLLVSLRLR